MGIWVKLTQAFCAVNEWSRSVCVPYLCWIISDREKLQQTHREGTAPLAPYCNRFSGAALSTSIPRLPVFISFQISLLLPSLYLLMLPSSFSLPFSCFLLPLLVFFPFSSPYFSLYGKAVNSLTPLPSFLPLSLSLYSFSGCVNSTGTLLTR